LKAGLKALNFTRAMRRHQGGQLADLSVLDRDYFTVAEEEIKMIESELTIVDGRIVYAKGEFAKHDLPSVPILPDWSPVHIYNGYYSAKSKQAVAEERKIILAAQQNQTLAKVHPTRRQLHIARA
jgi:hypothetical protein